MRGVANRGISVAEALVMLVIATSLAALLLPSVAKGARLDFRAAERGLQTQAMRGGEATFRHLVRASGPGSDVARTSHIISGDAQQLELAAFLQAPTLCGDEGWSRVTLIIVQDAGGGVLSCRSGRREAELARWRESRGAFAFLDEEEVWRSSAPVTGQAPRLVRFSLEDGQRERLVWIEALARIHASQHDGDVRDGDGGGDLDR